MMGNRKSRDHMENGQTRDTFKYNPSVKLPDTVGRLKIIMDRIIAFVLFRLA